MNFWQFIIALSSIVLVGIVILLAFLTFIMFTIAKIQPMEEIETNDEI